MKTIYSQVQQPLNIPVGRLAIDPAKLKRKQLAEDLRAGKPLKLGQSGDVTGKEQTQLVTQKGKLAIDPAKLKRKQLAEDLRAGKPLKLGQSGDVTGKEQTQLVTQKGKLAAQWYDYDKELLEDEISAMNECFPQFRLEKIEDPSSRWNNCLCWVGTLKPGIFEDTEWEVMAIYTPNHPQARMGGSVCVYLLDPTIENVKEVLGYYPHHLIPDQEGGKYLCTTRAEDMSNGDYVTSAVQTLTWAVKWLTAFELVCTGDLSEDLFNAPVGI